MNAKDNMSRARSYLLAASNDDCYIDISDGSVAHKLLAKLLAEVREEGRAEVHRANEAAMACQALGSWPGAFDE